MAPGGRACDRAPGGALMGEVGANAASEEETAEPPFGRFLFAPSGLNHFAPSVLKGDQRASERLASARESPVRGEETMHSSTLFNAFARVQSTTTPPTWQDSVADGQNRRTPVILQVRRANKRAFRESNSLCVSVCASRRSAASIRSGVRSRSADKNGTRS